MQISSFCTARKPYKGDVNVSGGSCYENIAPPDMGSAQINPVEILVVPFSVRNIHVQSETYQQFFSAGCIPSYYKIACDLLVPKSADAPLDKYIVIVYEGHPRLTEVAWPTTEKYKLECTFMIIVMLEIILLSPTSAINTYHRTKTAEYMWSY